MSEKWMLSLRVLAKPSNQPFLYNTTIVLKASEPTHAWEVTSQKKSKKKLKFFIQTTTINGLVDSQLIQ